MKPAGARLEKPGAEPESQEHCGGRRQCGRQAIGPDRVALRRAECRNGCRLQPIDPDRLLVARLVLEADADEIAGLQHLPRRLREARLVAVERRDRREPGRVEDQAQKTQQRIGPEIASPTQPCTPALLREAGEGADPRSGSVGAGTSRRARMSARLDGGELGHRRQRPPQVMRPARLGPADGDAGQRATVSAHANRAAAPRPRSVTTLATRRPPGGRLAHACASKPAAPIPPPIKIASGGDRSFSASGAAPSTMRNSGTPSAAALRAIIAARAGACSMAMADRPSPSAQPFYRDRAATRSDIPQGFAGQGASAARVAARTSRLVSWPSCSNTSSGRPAISGNARAPRSGEQAIAIVLRSGTRRSPQVPRLVSGDGFAAAAEMGEHGEAARPPTEPGEQPGDLSRRPAVFRQDQNAAMRARDAAAGCRAAGRAR